MLPKERKRDIAQLAAAASGCKGRHLDGVCLSMAHILPVVEGNQKYFLAVPHARAAQQQRQVQLRQHWCSPFA